MSGSPLLTPPSPRLLPLSAVLFPSLSDDHCRDELSTAAFDDSSNSSSSITAIRTSTKTSDAEVAMNPGSSLRESSDRDTTPALPIDAHRETILEHIRNNRVTVIHGETGSGKSSRIPVMIVEDALERSGDGDAAEVPRPRMFVSQPRRAAARALAQRVREESERTGVKFGVAMRLGHGVREGPPKAEVTFATTGYIVRLIANSPGLLDSHTHLIIDEVKGAEGEGRGERGDARIVLSLCLKHIFVSCICVSCVVYVHVII